MSHLNRIASQGTQICLVISTFQNKGKGVLQKQFASLSCNKKVTKNQVVLSFLHGPRKTPLRVADSLKTLT